MYILCTILTWNLHVIEYSSSSCVEYDLDVHTSGQNNAEWIFMDFFYSSF